MEVWGDGERSDKAERSYEILDITGVCDGVYERPAKPEGSFTCVSTAGMSKPLPAALQCMDHPGTRTTTATATASLKCMDHPGSSTATTTTAASTTAASNTDVNKNKMTRKYVQQIFSFGIIFTFLNI